MPGSRATPEQLARVGHRYAVAAHYGEGKDVLEVGCGPGLGLGHLARGARRLVGADYSDNLLRYARRHYGDRIPMVRLDAQALPFRSRSFDVVILFEAIYYLERPQDFLAESRRVLRPDGVLLLCSANPSWSGFGPSPFSVGYYTVPRLAELLERHGFACAMFGCVPAGAVSLAGRVVSFIRWAAVSLGLMPKTMKGKELFKRIFYGELVPLPPEVDAGKYEETFPLVPLPADRPSTAYKVLYAIGRVR